MFGTACPGEAGGSFFLPGPEVSSATAKISPEVAQILLRQCSATTQALATVDPVASLDGSALCTTQVPHSELPKPSFEVGLGSSSVSKADPALGCCRISPETSVLAEKNDFFRYEGSAPPAEVGVSVRPCVTSAADSPRKTTKPLHFYNRKHKVKRASKMDMGKLAGEVICVAPGAVPLVGNQCSVTGGSSGLFSAFEHVGLTGAKVEDPLLSSSVEAGVGLGSQFDKSSDPLLTGPGSQSDKSPAKGMLRRGFLKPSLCGGVSGRSP
ncbi:hypothetical protein SLA2020_225960 [Shorea laevis]